jgi:hypothetical protein
MSTRVLLLSMLLLSVSISFAEDWAGDAGKADSVKSLPGRDFESAKAAGLPLFIYFFDPETRPNNRAKWLEGRGGIAHVDVRDKMKSFLCLKIKTDGSDFKGWPASLLNPAQKSASLVLMSADLQQMVCFDKSFTNEQISPAVITDAMAKILAYEQQKKAAIADINKFAGTNAKPGEKESKTPAPDVAVPGLAKPDAKGNTNAAPIAPAHRRPAKGVPADE